MRRRRQVPSTVRTAGVIEWPMPLSAAPPISYVLMRKWGASAIIILMYAYDATSGLSVKIAANGSFPRRNVQLITISAVTL